MSKASKVRYLCSELVKVEWRNGPEAVTTAAILEEIWSEGACVQTAEPLPAGTRVWILARRVLFLGTLEECRFEIDGYYSQVVFDADSRWSSRRYKPEHMVSTQAVLARWLKRNLSAVEIPKVRTAGGSD